MDQLDAFIANLKAVSDTPTVTNPYLDSRLADNLRHYLVYLLQQQGPRVLLVGEAPGYRGCRITGIPFSSGTIFERFEHPLLRYLKDRIFLSRIESENTATMVWDYLSKTGRTPMFWSSFPFHPHPKGNDQANRAPTASELQLGVSYLRMLSDMYQPDVIAGVGSKGTVCVCKAFPNMKSASIRHPSFGGKQAFISGMNRLYFKG